MKTKRCFILFNGLICGHVHYSDFEYDYLQVRFFDKEGNIISSFLGTPKFSEDYSFICGLEVDYNN